MKNMGTYRERASSFGGVNFDDLRAAFDDHDQLRSPVRVAVQTCRTMTMMLTIDEAGVVGASEMKTTTEGCGDCSMIKDGGGDSSPMDLRGSDPSSYQNHDCCDGQIRHA